MSELKPGLYAVLDTTLGEITCQLFPEKAPKTVENFVGLAQGSKEFRDPKTRQNTKRAFYDGLNFHRVIPQFMIQSGCRWEQEQAMQAISLRMNSPRI